MEVKHSPRFAIGRDRDHRGDLAPLHQAERLGGWGIGWDGDRVRVHDLARPPRVGVRAIPFEQPAEVAVGDDAGQLATIRIVVDFRRPTGLTLSSPNESGPGVPSHAVLKILHAQKVIKMRPQATG